MEKYIRQMATEPDENFYEKDFIRFGCLCLVLRFSHQVGVCHFALNRRNLLPQRKKVVKHNV
ncbi:hypothetical protein [Dissulfuribacter thermophilus]|uniref:hypothetical protein n=1 Tax=Dissulfuribacter thermophilus TaxID=1156395 RepID=UPI0008363B5A|nr:hypothetical protein [Dissulfuribacter thermophilus]